MIEPVALEKLIIATLSAGAIVMFGACYAIFFALGQLRGLHRWQQGARYAFAGVVGSTLMLAWALQLTGGWLFLVAVLLIGYYAAPRAIYSLSVATHESDESDLSEPVLSEKRRMP